MPRYIAVFAVALAVFSFVQPWGGFSDPDAFYHGTMGELIVSNEYLISNNEFKWLDLTTLGTHYVNQHFLFHVSLVPFVALFGTLAGNQAAAVVFASLFITLCYWLLRKLDVLWPEAWAAILLFTPPLLVRLSLGKASPLAIGLFMLGLAGVQKRFGYWLIVLGIVYALTHAGWPLLIAVAVFMVLMEAVFGRWVFETKITDLIARSKAYLKQIGFLVIGIVIGCVLHPNRREMLTFLWTQVFQVGVATPYDRVIMGSEWYGYAPFDLFRGLSLMFIGALVIGYGLIFTRVKQLDREYVVHILSWSSAAGVLCVLTLKSARFVEYLVPLAVFAMAFVSRLIDQEMFVQEGSKQKRWILVLCSVLIFLSIGRGVWGVHDELWKTRKSFTRFSAAVAAIRSVTPAGERIFHSDWAHFPLLFSQAREYSYVAGLDPTFLLSASPELSDAYTDVTLGKNTTTVYEVVRDLFDAKTVFVEKRDSSKLFQETVRSDTRFDFVFENEEASVFRIRE
ncbi:hypothetical protein IT407_04400 [Candidatus Uhrbacteria bacterium]|nr:hypothetical protein [Candidatus Uhrbacteria bacterium]